MSAKVTTIRSSADGRKEESIDKAVSDIFDELLSEISTKTKLHHSEQVGRDNRVSNCNSTKLYDFVNSYHAFCKLCEQHFYSRSVANDINSFFQKHVNTSYHRQQRMANPCPDDVPILTWEQTLHSAKCNVCDLSGLNSFVISTRSCIKKLMCLHVCLWPRDQRETNDKFLRKLVLLKKYCGLRIFREKFLKTINGREVCLLCGMILPWSGEKAICHLKSEVHYQNFCLFVWKNFSFSPKDILNGFNLETVTRWLIVYDPPLWTKFVDYNELVTCLNDTNNCRNPYPEDKKSDSYSPVFVKTLLQNEELDFIHKNLCLLCNVEVGPEHFDSSMHRAKAVDLGESSFLPQNYIIYLEKKQKRLLPYLHMIKSYEKLKEELEQELKQEPKQQSKEETAPLPLPGHYIKSLFANKLSLVDKVFTAVDGAELFCHLCDQYLRKSYQEVHLGSDDHNTQVEKWKELRENFSNERYLEPFKKIRNVIVCLVCGVVIHTKSFFSHLKGGMHARKLDLYTSLDLGVPISSAFKFQEDHSCCCTICNSTLSKTHSLKVMLKNIRCHWPCPEMKKGRKKMGDLIQPDADLVEATASPHEDRGSETEVKYTRVAEKEENTVNASDETVTNNVLDKSPCVTDCLDNSGLVDGKVKTRRVGQMECPSAVVKESFSDSDQGLGLSSCTTSACTSSSRTAENGNKEKEAVAGEKKMKREKRSEAMEINSANQQEGKEEEKEEVLLIRGLPKRKRKLGVIYPLFEAFGKILYVMFDSKVVVVAFAERGIAGAAALEAKNVLQEPKIGVAVSERNFSKKKGKAGGEVALDEDVINLLQEPPKLMEFALCLIFQAMKASQSPVETKREQLVCSMIVQAVLEIFPRCRCYPFGSRLTGLSLTNSDLDVFLDCGDMYDGFKNTTPSTEKKLVRTVAAALRKVKDVSDIIVVDSARVPIVSFHHKPTNLDCDISFKNGLSIQNSLLIKFLVSLDWRVKPLILFMKYWAKQNGLHGSPYFSSYALSMLVINYLEQLESPVLPTIESLQNSYVGRRVTIGGWDCSINTSKSVLPKLDNIDPLPTLLVGLFEFYATFDFNKNVVFPLTGKALPREAFSDSGKGKLPMCFKRHIINLPSPLENLVSDKFPICIVDPFDLSHVLTKSFTFQGLMQFIYFCQMSRQYLKKGLNDSLAQ